MTVCAWVYDDYYCWGISQNYRGVYKDKDEALQMLRGSRHENENLELMDLKTNGFTKYRWKSYYKLVRERIEPGDPEHDSSGDTKNIREWLVYKYGKPEERVRVEYKPYDPENYTDDTRRIFEMGYWSTDLDDD